MQYISDEEILSARTFDNASDLKELKKRLDTLETKLDFIEQMLTQMGIADKFINSYIEEYKKGEK